MVSSSSRTRWLQLKVMNCKDLKAFNFFQKLSVYALVSLLSDDDDLSRNKLDQQQQQQQRTPTDTQGEGNPEWNHEMRFDLELGGHGNGDDDNIFLHFDLRSELAVFGDKSVGQVRVLLKDLINKEEESIIRFVSYEVRSSDGKPNGVLNFSYKVLNNLYNGGGGGSSSPNINVHIHGYPIVDHINHHHYNPDVDQTHEPLAAEVHCSSSSPSSYVHYPSVPPPENLQIPSGQSQESYYSAAAAAPHQFHYPSLETPHSILPQVGYIDYPPPEDRFHYMPPPPPPPAALLPPLHPLQSQPPFPPPPPPPPPYPHHVGQGAVYHQPSPWLYEHPYPRPPHPLEDDYAYPYGMHNKYYKGST